LPSETFSVCIRIATANRNGGGGEFTITLRRRSINGSIEERAIRQGSFYQYFRDKKDLYLHLISLVGRA
jgi:hypothetical protein